jgi:hypothetical protein
MAAWSGADLDPSRILQVSTGYWASKTLQSAVELGLFTQLGAEAMTGKQIGERLGLHPRAIYDFLDALVALRFLERDGDGAEGRYRNTAETATFLDTRSPRYIGSVVEMAGTRSYHHWASLTEALQTGQPQSEAKQTSEPLFDTLYRDPGKLEQFMMAMAGAQLDNFHALAGRFDFSRYQTLCDVGGATGQLCAIIAARYPNLHCTSFDLPAVAPIATKAVAAAGLADRVDIVSGDFFTDALPPADVVTMGNILHSWNVDRKMHLIRSAYAALPVGGVLIVIENIIDDARRENAFGLMLSLHMLIELGDGFEYTGADFAGWCQEVGFRQVDIRPLAGFASAGIAYK